MRSILYVYINSMFDFQKKKRIRKVIYSPITLIFLTIIFISLLKGVWNVQKKTELSSSNLEKEKIELQKLVTREQNLASSIDYLKTEQGIESEIRTKFRVAKDGEMVAIIIDDKIGTSSLATSTPKKSLLYRLFHWPQ